MVFLIFDIFIFFLLALGIAGPTVYGSMLYRFGMRASKTDSAESETKRLAVIIPVHRDAVPLVDKLEAMNLPLPCVMEIIVACDGEVQNLDLLEPFSQYISIMPLPRKGKNATLNAAVEKVTADIVVISDRDAVLPATSFEVVSRCFTSRDIGGCCGLLVINNDSVQGQKSHWNRENRIKFLESETLGNLTAGSGSAIAIRRALWIPIPEGVADDFFIALHVKSTGKQFLFLPEFLAATPPRSKKNLDTFKRQQRITLQSFATLWCHRQLLSFKYGHFAAMLWMHKVLRRMVPLLLMLLTLSAYLAASASLFQSVLFGLCLAAGSICMISIILTEFGRSLFNLTRKISWLSSVQLGVLCGGLLFFINKQKCKW